MKFLDRYHNHFSESLRAEHLPLSKDRNYLMRFNTYLPYSFAENQNAFSIVYSNSSSVMNLVTTNGSSKLKKNHFTLINPGTDWEFYCKVDERIDVMSFLLSKSILDHFNYSLGCKKESLLLDQPFDNSGSSHFFIENTYNASHSRSGRFLKHLFEISNTPEYELMDAREISLEMMSILYNEQNYYNQRIENIKGKKESTRKEVFKRLVRACEYIHDNYEHEKINLDDLALVSGLSEYHLYSSFKSVYNKTPHQYLNKIRMQKAMEYLNFKDFSVIEVSNMLNFPDLPSFSKLFKKTYGVSPSRIKDQQIKII